MTIALIHFAAEHKAPEANRVALLALNRQAAEAGASLILNTEMAISGYSFDSRADIAPYTETQRGETIRELGALAARFGVYIGVAFAERDPATDIFYNAAFVVGPEGRPVARSRKILAERRWAASGRRTQQATADTPWGRIGIAICADSYNGLITRLIALDGVDLLWIPANWPKMGDLDPVTIWQARALENGYYVAACNRTGIDLTMDCRQAVSAVFDPSGTPLFSGTSPTSRFFLIDIPLDEHGRWAGIRRPERMAARIVDHYRPVYLRPWVEDLTGFYKLPEPGPIAVNCLVPRPDVDPLALLEQELVGRSDDSAALWVLPEMDGRRAQPAVLADMAKRYRVAVAAAFTPATADFRRALITPEGIHPFGDAGASSPGEYPFDIVHFGPVALTMVSADDFVQPEFATAISKLGGDLVILSEARMSSDAFLLSRVKTLAGIAVAACARNGAQITGIQEMHHGWDRQDRSGPGVCAYTLDTRQTRRKRFLETIDFDRLLSTGDR